MNYLKDVFSSFGFMVGFMITCIFMQMLLGGKFLNRFLWLILFGMVITNYQAFNEKLDSMTKLQKDDETSQGDNIKGMVNPDSNLV